MRDKEIFDGWIDAAYMASIVLTIIVIVIGSIGVIVFLVYAVFMFLIHA